jgi:hypothetical protein
MWISIELGKALERIAKFEPKEPAGHYEVKQVG